MLDLKRAIHQLRKAGAGEITNGEITNGSSQTQKIRQCNDDNPKVTRCFYHIKLDGTEVERIYILCAQCRELDIFRDPIKEEAFVKRDESS